MIELVNIVHVYLIIFQEFKKQFAWEVTISWLPMVKPRPHVLLPPQNLGNVSCWSSVWLPPHMLADSPGFCRAVGGPTASSQPYRGSTTTTSLVSATSPMAVLNYMCEINGLGQPQIEITCRHAGPDGYLHFSYKVFNFGINILEGVVRILPGASIASTMEESRGAVAEQVMCRLFHDH